MTVDQTRYEKLGRWSDRPRPHRHFNLMRAAAARGDRDSRSGAVARVAPVLQITDRNPTTTSTAWLNHRGEYARSRRCENFGFGEEIEVAVPQRRASHDHQTDIVYDERRQAQATRLFNTALSNSTRRRADDVGALIAIALPNWKLADTATTQRHDRLEKTAINCLIGYVLRRPASGFPPGVRSAWRRDPAGCCEMSAGDGSARACPLRERRVRCDQ